MEATHWVTSLASHEVPTVDGGAAVKSYQLYRDVWNSEQVEQVEQVEEVISQFQHLFNFMKCFFGKGNINVIFCAKLRLVVIAYPLFKRERSI